jgi:hypothetical protein
MLSQATSQRDLHAFIGSPQNRLETMRGDGVTEVISQRLRESETA